MSARLVAAGRVRQLALSGASELETSRALLAELSELLRTYHRRKLVVVGTEDDRQAMEVVSRVGSAELRAWWVAHNASLVELHRELARAHLEAAGVAA